MFTINIIKVHRMQLWVVGDSGCIIKYGAGSDLDLFHHREICDTLTPGQTS